MSLLCLTFEKQKIQAKIEELQKRSVRKGGLRNFSKFTGKHLCQSFFFDKVANLSPATLLKKGLWHRCFLVRFEKFLRTTFL